MSVQDQVTPRYITGDAKPVAMEPDELEARIAQSGISWNEAAARLGVNRSTLRRMRSGAITIHERSAAAIRAAFALDGEAIGEARLRAELLALVKSLDGYPPQSPEQVQAIARARRTLGYC